MTSDSPRASHRAEASDVALVSRILAWLFLLSFMLLTAIAEGTASCWEGCRLGALPRLPADHFPLPSSASLSTIEADSGLIRAVEGGRT